MSFNDTYVGPYARCIVERVSKIRLQITCPTEGCENHEKVMRKPYCDLCGARVASLPHTELGFAIDQWDVTEEIGDALSAPGGDEYMRWAEANAAHLWISNRRMPGRDPHLESREPFSLAEITSDQLEKESAVFLSTFEDALAILQERYGNLTLHWGIIP